VLSVAARSIVVSLSLLSEWLFRQVYVSAMMMVSSGGCGKDSLLAGPVRAPEEPVYVALL